MGLARQRNPRSGSARRSASAKRSCGSPPHPDTSFAQFRKLFEFGVTSLTGYQILSGLYDFLFNAAQRGQNVRYSIGRFSTRPNVCSRFSPNGRSRDRIGPPGKAIPCGART